MMQIYSGRARLHVSLSAATCPHYCTDPNVTWGNGKGCPLLVQHWADLQSVHGLRCYGSIERMRNVSECLYSLYAWFSLSFYLSAVFLKNLFMDFHEILRRDTLLVINHLISFWDGPPKLGLYASAFCFP